MCLLKKIISKKIFTILKTRSVCEVGWEHFGDRASCWTRFGNRATLLLESLRAGTHFGDRALVSLSSKVFESETTSCPKLPGANLTLGAGFFYFYFFFMERFEDESGDMSSGGAANEPLLKSTSLEALAAMGKSLDLSGKDLQD